MRVLVNGLSVGSLSGRHVLYGHLRQLAQWTTADHEWIVVSQADQEAPATLRLPNVRFFAAPVSCRHWGVRTAWETVELSRLMRRERVGLYFTPNGVILPRSPAPQVSLAQNPWCLSPGIHQNATQRFKARLQRAAYRRAYASADLMVYNSRHMRELYGRNAPGMTEGRAIVAYQGIDDETHEQAARSDSIQRDELTILSVSAMAHWKGAETLVAALGLLLQRGVRARLRLVGPWPDRLYAARVRDEINRRGLTAQVEITGQVSVDELHRSYASARVFCLMSQCESFGIPAVEAQAFGTPVVGSNVCAMPEICGAGGVFGPPLSPEPTADLLEPLLTDGDRWRRMSRAARDNAGRYRWSTCSQPLLAMLELGARRPADARDDSDVATAVR